MSPQRSILISVFLFVATRVCFAQADVLVANYENTDSSPTATTSGLYFVDLGGSLEPINAGLPSMSAFQHVNISLFGGPDTGSLSHMITITDGSFVNVAQYPGYESYVGIFNDLNGNAPSVPGVVYGGSGYLQQFLWTGFASTYDEAVASGTAYTASSIWYQHSIGLTVPSTFVEMPATTFTIPEPSSFALFGLGALVLLVRRRGMMR